MKAAIFHGPGSMSVEEVETPEVSHGNVLIRVKAAGICGSDLHFYKGEFPVGLPDGSVLCHELSGEVTAVGEGVANIHEGDRVAVEPLIPCGTCAYCRTGEYAYCGDLKHIGVAFHGGFAEYTLVPQENIFQLPNTISYDEASLLDCYAVAVHGLRRVRVDVGDVVVVFGTGAVALTVMQTIKAAGVRKVILVGRRDEALRIAEKAGADVTINILKQDIVEEVNNVTAHEGADVAMDCVGGDAPSLTRAIEITRPGGSIGIVGMHTQNYCFDCHTLVAKEISLIPVWSYSKWGHRAEFSIALDLMVAGKVNARPLITHRFPLSDIVDAFKIALDTKRNHAVKVLIKS